MRKDILKCVVGLTFGLGACLVMAGRVIEYNESGEVLRTYESEEVVDGVVHYKYANGLEKFDLGDEQYRVKYPDRQLESHLLRNRNSEAAHFESTYDLNDGTKVIIKWNGELVEQSNIDGTKYTAFFTSSSSDDTSDKGGFRSPMVWAGNINDEKHTIFKKEYVGKYGLWKLVPQSQ